jgi:hypothetical protein
MSARTKDQAGAVEVKVSAPNFVTAKMRCIGTAPLVVHRFANKGAMIEAQEAGRSSSIRKKREPKDFAALYEAAKHVSAEGWCGVPAAGLRAAMVRACKLCGIEMTAGKAMLFVEADGYDREDGTPLVKITRGEPKMSILPARNSNGSVDMRSRPMWEPGWEIEPRIKYDAEYFSATDIANLLLRVGISVGICEGRPFSKDSCGQGWGTFTLAEGGA